MRNQTILLGKTKQNASSNLVLANEPFLHRGMNLDECRAICTSPIIPLKEKTFFRLIYETQLRPFEVLNLQIENWDRKQKTVTAVRVKQKCYTNKHTEELIHLPTMPRTAIITDNTNEMIRTLVGVRKKGNIFVNERKGEPLTATWYKNAIVHYAKLLSIQKVIKYDIKGRPHHLITCMALREAGERHHDNAGGSRKLSAVAAGHTMTVKERHYEKVGDDFEQVHESYKNHHPAFTEGW